MARVNPAQRGAVFGEISPRLEGRDNLDQYAESLRSTQNYLLSTQGAIIRRSGTQFMGSPKDDTVRRLIPFEFSVDQVYVLEFGDQYMRVFVPSGPLEIGGVPVELATPYTADDVPELWYAQQGNLLYITHPKHPPRILKRTDLTTFVLEPVVWRDGRQPMGFNNLTEAHKFQITSGVGGSDLTLTRSGDGARDFVPSDVGRFVRMSNDTMQQWFEITAFTSAASVTVQVRDNITALPILTPTDDWSIGAFSATVNPALVTFFEGRAIYANTVEAPGKLWASNTDDFNFFEQRDAKGVVADNNAFTRQSSADRLNSILWLMAGNQGLGVGTASGEFALAAAGDTILTPNSATLAQSTRRGAEPVRPAVVDDDIIFVQRSGAKLRRISFQITDDRFASEDLTIFAEHMFRSPIRQLAYQQTPDSTLWAVRADGELVGITLEKEQRVVSFHRHRIAGFSDAAPAKVLDATVVPEGEAGDALWLLVERADGLDRVLSVEKLHPTFQPGLSARSTQAERIAATETAWFLDSALELDAPLAIASITRSSPVDLTVIGHGLTTGDRVRVRDTSFTSLNRKTFSVTVLDQNTIRLDGADTSAEPVAYTGGANIRKETTTVSGLGHLEGRTVAILADGGERDSAVVTGGAITLDTPASIIRVGLPYRSFVLTQRFVSQLGLGTTSGQRSRLQRVVLRLMNTLGMQVGYGAQPEFMEQIEFRALPVQMDEPLPLFSGDIDVNAASAWGQDPSLLIQQTGPLPGAILAIYTRMEANER